MYLNELGEMKKNITKYNHNKYIHLYNILVSYCNIIKQQ